LATETWSRFTVSAKKSIAIAQQAAMLQGGNEVCVEDILLGIVDVQEPEATPIFRQLGLLPESIAARLLPQTTVAPILDSSDMVLSPQGRYVVSVAYAEAERLGSISINTLHLLIGVLYEVRSRRGGMFSLFQPKVELGVAGTVLKELGLTLESLEQAIRELDTTTLLRAATNQVPSETLLRPVNSGISTPKSELLRSDEVEKYQ